MAKEREGTRVSHFLESTKGGTSQDTRMQASKGGLTSWRAQRERQVNTAKEREGKEVSHSLESTNGGTSQDTESKQAREGGLTIWRVQRDKSKCRKEASKQAILTNWRAQRGGQVSPRTPKASKQARGHSLPEECRGRDKSRHQKGAGKQGTHLLESTQEWTSQDTERKLVSKGELTC